MNVNKQFLEYVAKAVIYIVLAICAACGVYALSSCSVNSQVDTRGKGIGIFHYSDTFEVTHGKTTKITVD